MRTKSEEENATPGSRQGDTLTSYRAKRDFAPTPEPSAATASGPANAARFVVQRHRASRLHYDFRLEMDGVLASWAVPKGPSMDSKLRRLAIHVEDHPLDYFDFEGLIPTGNYGAGDVIVWDWGTWAPGAGENPGRAVAAGELHVELHGVKLSGRFMLIRTNRVNSRQEQWLLFRKRDEQSIEGWAAEDHLRSVKSGLMNDEVRAAVLPPTAISSLTMRT